MSEEPESGGEETESERRLTRAEIATYLGRLSAAFDGDETVQFMVGDDEVTVSPPNECEFEIEYERDDEEEEIEIEIEWPTGDTADTDDRARATDDDGSDESEPRDESEPSDDAGVPKSGGDSGDADVGGNVTADSNAEAENSPASIESQATFQLFEDTSGEWRWRLVHRNGNVIATSGEGYTRKANAEKGMRSVKRNAQGASTEIDE